VGVTFTLASARKDERALISTFSGCVVIGPLGALLPKFLTAVHLVKTSLMLTAFLASIALLLSFRNKPKETEISAKGASVEMKGGSRQ
jgi:hypothetical protein